MTQGLQVAEGHKGRAHSETGASGYARWGSCSASVHMLRMAPPMIESAAAAEGTFAHERLEMRLNGIELTELDFVTPWSGGLPDLEMMRGVQEAVDWVNEKLDENPGAILFVEKPVEVTDDIWGTVDIFIYVPSTQTLYVLDFKYGRGRVDASTKQLWIYALGVEKRLFEEGKTVRRVIVGICQPRYDHEDGTTRCVEVDLVDLFDFLLEAEKAVLKTKEAAAVLQSLKERLWDFQDPFWTSGEWKKWFAPSAKACQWCVRATCPGAQAAALETLGDIPGIEEFTTITLPDPNDLDIARLIKIDDGRKMVEQWFKAVHNRLLQAGLQGADLEAEGRKLVLTRPRRSFLGDEEVVLSGLDKLSKGLLGVEDFTSRKLKGLGDVEDLLMMLPDEVLVEYGKNKTERKRNIKIAMADLMEKKEGKNYQVVPLTDKRDAVQIDSLADFDLSAIEDFNDEGEE